MIRLIFIFLAGFVLHFTVVAQDRIALLNGEVLEVTIKSNNDGIVRYYYNKKGKQKEGKLEEYRIFSIQKSGTAELITYRQDTTIGNYFSEDEMRMFIYGERDARNNYKTHWFFVGSASLGFGAVLFDTYDKGFFKSEPSIFPVILPLVFPIVSAKIGAKIKPQHVSESAYMLNTEYIDGFKKVARFKRMKSSLLGTVTGVGLGMATYFIAR